jgi:hypothetical protein
VFPSIVSPTAAIVTEAEAEAEAAGEAEAVTAPAAQEAAGTSMTADPAIAQSARPMFRMRINLARQAWAWGQDTLGQYPEVPNDGDRPRFTEFPSSARYSSRRPVHYCPSVGDPLEFTGEVLLPGLIITFVTF